MTDLNYFFESCQCKYLWVFCCISIAGENLARCMLLLYFVFVSNVVYRVLFFCLCTLLGLSIAVIMQLFNVYILLQTSVMLSIVSCLWWHLLHLSMLTVIIKTWVGHSALPLDNTIPKWLLKVYFFRISRSYGSSSHAGSEHNKKIILMQFLWSLCLFFWAWV